MEQFTHPNQNEELLNQTVTDSELREILERIGHDEFNGNPLTTIRDIAEGTSADPAIIGRILGEIRKEDWEQRFGLQLKDHEERIESLETKPQQPPTVVHHYHEVQVPVPVPVPAAQSAAKPTSYNSGAKQQYGYGSNKVKKTDTTVTTIIVAIFFLCFVGLFIAMVVSENKRKQEFDKKFNDFNSRNPFSFPIDSGENRWLNGSSGPSVKDLEEAVKQAKEKNKSGDTGYIGPFGERVNQQDLDALRRSMSQPKSPASAPDVRIFGQPTNP